MTSIVPDEMQVDQSYDMCLARWGKWTIDTWGSEEDGNDNLRREAVVASITALGPTRDSSMRDTKASVDKVFDYTDRSRYPLSSAFALLEAVGEDGSSFKTAINVLLQTPSIVQPQV